MRRLICLCIGLIATTCFPPVRGADNVVQEFSGDGSTTTALFQVHDHWEVRWNARRVVSVAVMASDGTIVAGGAGVLRGSLFVPLGGKYYFKIMDGTTAPPAGTNSAPANPTSPPPAPENGGASPAEPSASWHLQVVELGPSVSSDQTLTVYTPYFVMPDSAVTPAPAAPPPPKLTDAQAHAVVTIKGDNAQGAGFLVHNADGNFVVTHLSLLAANPNLQILTSAGSPITTLSLKGAADRDLAMFAIKDDHYSYLPEATGTAGVDTGDAILIPDLSPQNESGEAGKVVEVTPVQIDFDNDLEPGSDGAPVIEAKNGKALAILTAQKKVDVSYMLARAWPANPAPGSDSIIPYFGLRLAGVSSWETYDWTRFQTESAFLRQFHIDTRCLDSYLNGRMHRIRFAQTSNSSTGPPDSRFYLANAKLRAAQDSYKQLASGADDNQRLDAARELLFDLQTVVNTDLDTIENTTNLYSFDQTWAKEELAYRLALKKELDDMGNNLQRLDNIAHVR